MVHRLIPLPCIHRAHPSVTPETRTLNIVIPTGLRFEQHVYDECPAAAPNRVSYNTLISACARGGRPADAEATFERLVERQLEPDQVSFSTVISAHAREVRRHCLQRLQHIV